MTGVEIIIPAFLERFTEGARRDRASGSTIGECLMALVGRFPRLKPRLFREEGKLSRDLNIYLNDARVSPDELSRPVREGDKLYIAHVIIGG